MTHGYHVMVPAYGCWLPNDSRGSWSEFVGKWELVHFGRTTKLFKRRALTGLSDSEQRQRESARAALQYSPVQFTGHQALSIGRGIANAVERSRYTI